MENIISIVSSVGFPIAMCFIMGYYLKYTHDDHREDLKRLQEQHTEEMKAITEAVNNNTLVIQRLLDSIGDDK